MDTIPGLPQPFVCHGNEGPPLLLAAKVVDDFLLAGPPVKIDLLRQSFSRTILKSVALLKTPCLCSTASTLSNSQTVILSYQWRNAWIASERWTYQENGGRSTLIPPISRTDRFSWPGTKTQLPQTRLPTGCSRCFKLPPAADRSPQGIRFEDSELCLPRSKEVVTQAHSPVPVIYQDCEVPGFLRRRARQVSYGQTGCISGLYLQT